MYCLKDSQPVWPHPLTPLWKGYTVSRRYLSRDSELVGPCTICHSELDLKEALLHDQTHESTVLTSGICCRSWCFELQHSQYRYPLTSICLLLKATYSHEDVDADEGGDFCWSGLCPSAVLFTLLCHLPMGVVICMLPHVTKQLLAHRQIEVVYGRCCGDIKPVLQIGPSRPHEFID